LFALRFVAVLFCKLEGTYFPFRKMSARPQDQTQTRVQPTPPKKGNKIFGVMTKRRWFGVAVFLGAMLWTYTIGPPLEEAIISNQYFKDGVSYDYSTVRFEGDLSLIDSLFKRGFWPNVFTWQVGAYFNWTEGPLMMDDGSLLFSDVIKNRIYSYAPIKGMQIKVENSGDCTQKQLNKYVFPGSNGLLAHPTEPNVIFVAQTAQRRIVSVNLVTKERQVIAFSYNGNKLNSPDDMVLGPKKQFIYFTDPPYGFIEKDQIKKNPHLQLSTRKNVYIDRRSKIGFSGVYRVHISGEEAVELMDASIHRPNGIIFSTDYAKLFVANSIVEDLEIAVFDVDQETGGISNKIIWNEESLLKNSANLPIPISPLTSRVDTIDGIAIHPRGYLITTAANAKLCIINEKSGDLEAVIKLPDLLKITNVAVGQDENLYVTANHTIWQLKLQPLQSSTGGKTEI
jgi:sugar lactone lactonase YvrE